jgi:hypothetical protein
MFAMKAAIKSIRGSSVLMKSPIFVTSLLRREGPARPDPETTTNGIGTMSSTLTKLEPFAGAVAMTTRVWLDNGRQAWGNLMGKIHVKTVWDNLHVCVGGTAAAGKHSSPTAMTFGSSVVSSRLLSSSATASSSSISSRFGPMMSMAVPSSWWWNHFVQVENNRRIIELRKKMMAEYEAHQQGMAAAAAALVMQQKENLWKLEDTKAVEDYSGEGYTEMNAALRGGPSEMTDAVQVRVNAVVTAMRKLAVVQCPVYRRTDLPECVASQIQAGAVYHDLGFMSTSREQEQTAFFQGEYLFVINCRSGVDITEHAVTKDEAEVLYPPGMRFLITSVQTETVSSEDYDDEEVVVVRMDEVAA